MLSESYISATYSGGSAYGDVTPDNYLVSPQIRLGGSITFYAAARMNSYPAEKFSVLVSESGNTSASDFTHTELTVTLTSSTYSWNEYTVDLSAYSGMGYVAIRHYECNDQHLLYVDDVTIVEGEVSDGSVTASYVNGTSCTVTATPNTGYYFANWTENGTVVSNNASYTFTVTGDRDLVANFQDTPVTISQTLNLVTGWNWWSPCFEMDGTALMQALQTALGDKGEYIKSQGSSTKYYSDYNTWYGELTSLTPECMYEIKVSEPITITLSGQPVITGNHPITIKKGSNWIGCPVSQPVSLSNAFTGFTPHAGDLIKTGGSEPSSATYYEGYGWWGSLETLKPGSGYIYISKDDETHTFTFPSEKH